MVADGIRQYSCQGKATYLRDEARGARVQEELRSSCSCACARALPRPLVRRNAAAMHRPTVKPLWSPRQCARAPRRSTLITHRAHARSAAQTLYCAPVWPRPSRLTTVASAGARTDAVVRRCVHAKATTSPIDDMRSSGCTIGVCLAHSHPHGIGACGRRRGGPFCGGGLVPFEHHPTVPTTHST